MPDREKVLLVVGEWLVKAEGDLQAAAHLLGLGAKCPCFIVCFHAQQCAEKYMKAMLVLELIDFPKTHDLEKLMTLLPGAARPKLTTQEQKTLTEYATVSRYPGRSDISLSEARRAVAITRRLRKSIRRLLPEEVLQTSKP